MTAEYLRETAALMREKEAKEHALGHTDSFSYKAWLAVADLLEAEDAKQTPTTHLSVTFDGAPMFPVNPHVLAVARAYRGEQP